MISILFWNLLNLLIKIGPSNSASVDFCNKCSHLSNFFRLYVSQNSRKWKLSNVVMWQPKMGINMFLIMIVTIGKKPPTLSEIYLEKYPFQAHLKKCVLSLMTHPCLHPYLVWKLGTYQGLWCGGYLPYLTYQQIFVNMCFGYHHNISFN